MKRRACTRGRLRPAQVVDLNGERVLILARSARGLYRVMDETGQQRWALRRELSTGAEERA